jgi:hypothetical protein
MPFTIAQGPIVAEAELHAIEQLGTLPAAAASPAEHREDGEDGGAMRLRTYCKKTSPARTLVCPFCAADELASSTDRTKVWKPARIGGHVVIHLLSQTSSDLSCPVCSQLMRMDKLALHLDQQHGLPLASKSSEPLADDLSLNTAKQTLGLFQDWIAQGCRAKPRQAIMAKKMVASAAKGRGHSKWSASTDAHAPARAQQPPALKEQLAWSPATVLSHTASLSRPVQTSLSLSANASDPNPHGLPLPASLAP